MSDEHLERWEPIFPWIEGELGGKDGSRCMDGRRCIWNFKVLVKKVKEISSGNLMRISPI